MRRPRGPRSGRRQAAVLALALGLGGLWACPCPRRRPPTCASTRRPPAAPSARPSPSRPPSDRTRRRVAWSCSPRCPGTRPGPSRRHPSSRLRPAPGARSSTRPGMSCPTPPTTTVSASSPRMARAWVHRPATGSWTRAWRGSSSRGTASRSGGTGVTVRSRSEPWASRRTPSGRPRTCSGFGSWRRWTSSSTRTTASSARPWGRARARTWAARRTPTSTRSSGSSSRSR